MAKKNNSSQETEGESRKKYLSQKEVPSMPIQEALRVARAIVDNYGSNPTSPLKVAKALEMEPQKSRFKMLTGPSIAYGITSGGYNAEQIIITDLGKRVFKPLKENDDLMAKREAFLKPRIIKEFLENYNNSPLPRNDIAYNVLEEKGVPADKTEIVFNLIVEGAKDLGFIEVIKEKNYVNLEEITKYLSKSSTDDDDKSEIISDAQQTLAEKPDLSVIPKPTPSLTENRKVFISHGKNKDFVEPIKKLLSFGELQAVVSVDKQSVSQPVPDKVLSDMRSCSAAIIHVEDEMKLIDSQAQEFIVLNPNVLIEIGAAMALYGRRFILVVKEGIKLPTNLQGLYEVRYSGGVLDGNATIKLLEAINDIKNHPSPDRYAMQQEKS